MFYINILAFEYIKGRENEEEEQLSHIVHLL